MVTENSLELFSVILQMSRMLKLMQQVHPEKDYPSNMGQLWTEEEEKELLEELKVENIETIAQRHNRTVGGIQSRCKVIANKMFLNGISIDEITSQTKLTKECIEQTIKRRTPKDNELIDIKKDIKELKKSVKEIIEMLKAYEFEA